MKVFSISIVLSLMFSSQSYGAENNHHSHGDSSTITEVKPPKKFIANEALRGRMNSILSEMQKLSKTGSGAQKRKQVVTTGSGEPMRCLESPAALFNITPLPQIMI